jgi:hypothetical protein
MRLNGDKAPLLDHHGQPGRRHFRPNRPSPASTTRVHTHADPPCRTLRPADDSQTHAPTQSLLLLAGEPWSGRPVDLALIAHTERCAMR